MPRHLPVVLLLLLVTLRPERALAQSWVLNDPRQSMEVGALQEWFHRELEPPLYNDTHWSTTSLVLTYSARDWLNIGFEGGMSEFEPGDESGPEYQRYIVGGSVGVRAYQWGNWDVSVSARYTDMFDLDTSETLTHERVRSISGAVNLVRRFRLFNQTAAMWAGPTVVDDFVQTFPYDSLEAVESTSGTALGADLGGRLILGGWIAVYGFVSYVDDVQGGVGVCLHAGKGSL